MPGQRTIHIEVVLALPGQQCLVELEVPEGCTALEALRRSGLAPGGAGAPASAPAGDPSSSAGGSHAVAIPPLGIFGTLLRDPAAYLMREGDRLEIYRPLLIDPREARRARARTRR